MGGLITPSRIMPFAILESLVKVCSASSGYPLILRAILSNSIYLLAVPLPACNMFLNVLAIAPGPSLYLRYCLSAAAEYMVSRGLQPTPTSACLGTLPSYPDWEEFDSTFFSATMPPSDLNTFLVDSGFIALGFYARFMSRAFTPPGITRLHLGPTFYSDDVIWLHRGRPLLLLMLVAVSTLPNTFLQSSCQGSVLETEVYLELLQLLLMSIAVQLALPGPDSVEE